MRSRVVKLVTVILITLPLTSCKSRGTREDIGKIAGGILGAVVGEKIGSKKYGATLGLLFGAYIGGKIGERLDEGDRARMAIATQRSVINGNNNSWTNPKNKTAGQSRVVSTTTKPKPIKVKVLKSKVKKVPPLEIIGANYLASKVVNVRGGPSTEYVVVGKLKKEEAVRVVGQVKGQSWYMISEGGAGSGFVYKSLLSPAPTVEVAENTEVDATDIVEEQVAANTLCREIENTATLADGTKIKEKLTACQGPNGWEIKPVVS